MSTRAQGIAAAIALRLLLTAALTALLFSLRGLPLPGADRWYMSQFVENNAFPLFYRSLLTLWMHRLAYVIGHPFGLDGWNAMALSSSLAGALALQIIWAIRPGPAFLALNVLCGSFLVFAGHVENYAWVNLFLLAAFWALLNWHESRWPLWPAMAFYIAACLSHMLAIFYAPAMIYALRGQRRFNPLEALVPLLAFVFVVVGLSFSGRLHGTEAGLDRLMPLWEPWAPNHYPGLTLFSWEHLKMLAYFHYHAAYFAWPIQWGDSVWTFALPIELPMLFLLRKRIDSHYLKTLTLAVFCGLAWTTLWHPDWGIEDWDLFSQFAVPLHLLLAFLIVKK